MSDVPSVNEPSFWRELRKASWFFARLFVGAALLYGMYAAAVLLWHPLYGAITAMAAMIIGTILWAAWFSYKSEKKSAAREREWKEKARQWEQKKF